MNDLLMMNMDNQWQTGVTLEGAGYRFAAVKNGMLWASGWVRCDSEEKARAMAWSTGRQLEEFAS